MDDARCSTGLSYIFLVAAIVFLVAAIVAGALGFKGLSSAAATVAKILFGIFLILFVVFLLIGFGMIEALK